VKHFLKEMPWETYPGEGVGDSRYIRFIEAGFGRSKMPPRFANQPMLLMILPFIEWRRFQALSPAEKTQRLALLHQTAHISRKLAALEPRITPRDIESILRRERKKRRQEKKPPSAKIPRPPKRMGRAT
jgi:hypothetical protein